MATKRFTIDGYGQIELNNVAFRRDGRIEAQCHLDATDFETLPAENGMLLAIDRANRIVRFPDAGELLPIGLHYSTEHMYDERLPGLKNFFLKRGSFLPRMGLLAVGDKWTTNCLCYDDGEFADDDALIEALEACKETPVYGGLDVDGGATKLSATQPAEGPVLKVVEFTTMPDGQPAVMLQALKA